MKVLSVIWTRWEWTIPNMITLGRLLFGLASINVFYWLFWSPWMLLGCAVLSAVLDYVDGWWAKANGSTSISGKLFDPLADKFLGWNAIVVVSHYFATQTHYLVFIVVVFVCTAPLAINAIYDYMTISMRGSDEEMRTNPTAQKKQFLLFLALGFFLLAIAFHETAYAERNLSDTRAYLFTFMLMTMVGALLLWLATRLTAASARVYLSETKNPWARSWREVGWVKTLLACL